MLVTFSLFVSPLPICYDSQCNLLYMQLICVIFNCYIYFITQSGWLLARYFLDCESNFFGPILKYTSIFRRPVVSFKENLIYANKNITNILSKSKYKTNVFSCFVQCIHILLHQNATSRKINLWVKIFNCMLNTVCTILSVKYETKY